MEYELVGEGGLLNEVKEKGLIRPVSFNKDKLMKLATWYLGSADHRGDFSRYVSEVNKIMKESIMESFVKAQGLGVHEKMVEHPYTTIGSTVVIFAAISILIFKIRF